MFAAPHGTLLSCDNGGVTIIGISTRIYGLIPQPDFHILIMVTIGSQIARIRQHPGNPTGDLDPPISHLPRITRL